MSQKTSIISVKHHGAPIYRGNINGTDSYVTNPDSIMNWLCDGYRTRFNQHRSKRQKYDKSKNLVPIGKHVVNVTDKQARQRYSWLGAIPAMILQAPEKKENTEWTSALKRRKTLMEKGQNPGSMPRFKSRKREDQFFVCWFNNGSNALFHTTGRRTGVIVIKGKNPPGKRKNPEDKASWKLVIRIRVTQRIHDYTSVIVNWTTKTATFVNTPMSVQSPLCDDVAGVDRGSVYAIATSDGALLTPDKELIGKLDKKRRYYQRQMGKARARASKKDSEGSSRHVRQVMRGVRYQDNKRKAAECSERIQSYTQSWIQEMTTFLVKNYGVIVLEDLDVKKMTRHGGSRKRGMNRSFLSVSPAQIASCLEYKALLHGNRVVYVDPAYTSQRCHECGYTARENRESQSFFSCKNCGHVRHADINAACNIRSIYMSVVEGTDLPAYDHSGYTNGGGEIVKPTIPTGMKHDFYVMDQGRLDDAIDPVKVVSET